MAFIDTIVVGFIGTGASNVSAAVAPLFATMITLYLVLWGFALWRGLIQEPFSDFVVRIMKIALIAMFAVNAGVYNVQIAARLYAVPTGLVATLLSGVNVATDGFAGASTGSLIDQQLANFMDVYKLFADAAAAGSGVVEPLTLWLQGAFLLVFGVAVVIFGAALIILSKVALGIILALGPLFIICLLFEPTRNFFSSWLNQALNFVLLFVLTGAVVALSAYLTREWSTQIITRVGGDVPELPMVLGLVVLAGSIMLVLWQLPGIASGLAGGVQIGTLGAVGWVMRTGMRTAGAPARGAMTAYRWRRDRNTRRLANEANSAIAAHYQRGSDGAPARNSIRRR